MREGGGSAFDDRGDGDDDRIATKLSKVGQSWEWPPPAKHGFVIVDIALG